MDKDIVISIKTVFFTLGLLVAAYIVYRLGPVISVLLFSGLLVIALESIVRFLMKKTFLNKPLSRNLAVTITYALLIFALITVFTIGLPPVILEGQRLIVGLGTILQGLRVDNILNISVQNLLPQISDISSGVLSATLSVFSNVATVFSILILSIYMSLDWDNIKRSFVSLFPEKHTAVVLRTIEEVEFNLGQWIKGQLFLMVVIGTLSFFGFLILDVKYPLALGLIAGILEAVPILGPIITAVLAGVIAFADSPVKGLAVIVFFAIVQQLENNLLVPKVMEKVSGFSPLVILLALFIGSNFFGLVGALLAVPITMVSVVILKKFIAGNE